MMELNSGFREIGKCIWFRVGVCISHVRLCNPLDCSPPGSSVHGIFQARILEWVAISFSSRSSQPRDQTQVSHIADRLFTVWDLKNRTYRICCWIRNGNLTATATGWRVILKVIFMCIVTVVKVLLHVLCHFTVTGGRGRSHWVKIQVLPPLPVWEALGKVLWMGF